MNNIIVDAKNYEKARATIEEMATEMTQLEEEKLEAVIKYTLFRFWYISLPLWHRMLYNYAYFNKLSWRLL